MRYIRTLFTILFFLLCYSLPLTHAATEQRTALVIGNSAYSTSPLKNPANDATDMAATLTKLGFSVTLKQNASHQEMEDAIRELGDQLKKGGVGLFFYAGHGVQIGGRNYLLPVGAKINKETDIKFQAVDAEMVLAEMGSAGNSLNIVILDACRDNPFGKSFRSASRGLAIISDAPKGTFITYSTSPGRVAADGSGRNSPYAESLIRHMSSPGLPIEDVFKEVGKDMGKKTGGQQVPWELSSLEGKFFFRPGAALQKDVTSSSLDYEAEKRKIDAEKERLRQEQELDDQRQSLADEKRRRDETAKEAAERRKMEAEERQLEKEKAALAKQKALEEKRQKLAEEKERLAAEKEAQREARAAKKKGKKGTKVAMGKVPNDELSGKQDNVSPKLRAKFVFIPAGTFTMEGGSKDEKRHQVTISQPYYIQTTEVTQEQWKRVMGSNPSYFKNCGDDCPVENVSWNDVQDFISKLNRMGGTDKYRLPTEAEWEYAARSGGKQEEFSGTSSESDLGEYAWYKDNSGKKTHPVGQKKPNGLGLYDMSGNVSEWVQDWFGSYPSGHVTDPKGPLSGSNRVPRGGSWSMDAAGAINWMRFGVRPDRRYPFIGFRLVRTK